MLNFFTFSIIPNLSATDIFFTGGFFIPDLIKTLKMSAVIRGGK